MKVQAQNINGGPLLIIGSPLRKDLGVVVDLDLGKNGKAFPKFNYNSILSRGYWGKVTATSEDQEKAIKLARVEAKKPLSRPIPIFTG